MKKKSIALLLALVLVFGAAIGGTVAYIAVKSDTATNTFIAGKIDMEFEEGGEGDDGTVPDDSKPNDREYPLEPGAAVTKIATVTVNPDSEACYLFIELSKTNFDETLTYTMADGWTLLKNGNADVPGVYYRLQDEIKAEADGGEAVSYSVFKGNKLTVKSTVDPSVANFVNPSVAITAYAIQQTGFADNTSLTTPMAKAYAAWSAVQTQFTPAS